jgi:hypothetical protein
MLQGGGDNQDTDDNDESRLYCVAWLYRQRDYAAVLARVQDELKRPGFHPKNQGREWLDYGARAALRLGGDAVAGPGLQMAQARAELDIPGSVSGRQTVAEMQLQLGDRTAARARLQACLREQPCTPRLWELLASTYTTPILAAAALLMGMRFLFTARLGARAPMVVASLARTDASMQQQLEALSITELRGVVAAEQRELAMRLASLHATDAFEHDWLVHRRFDSADAGSDAAADKVEEHG